ncbi:peptide deformylase [Sphingomonas sp. dw_22]|uniref:peptide deformylase n=1 Tax=Sphingomonas sp. dw_22 TaxID=2721175 RepID=UPI001BD2F5EA|nr:peptide deformylase [Sphingomonas sp. dw_22]
MIREILKMGDPRLLRVARPVEDIPDFELRAITADMYETMHAANGVFRLPEVRRRRSTTGATKGDTAAYPLRR